MSNKIYRSQDVKMSNKLANRLYDLYKQTYANAGQELEITSVEALLNAYPCIFEVLEDEEGNIIAAFAYQVVDFYPKANKISLLMHDGSEEAKQQLMDRIGELLQTPGYVLEASGAVAKVLMRKVQTGKRGYGLKPFMDENKINTVLNLQEQVYKIKMNPNGSGEYQRLSYDKTKIMTEFLFGTPCEEWDPSNCEFEKEGNCKKDCTRKCKN